MVAKKAGERRSEAVNAYLKLLSFSLCFVGKKTTLKVGVKSISRKKALYPMKAI